MKWCTVHHQSWKYSSYNYTVVKSGIIHPEKFADTPTLVALSLNTLSVFSISSMPFTGSSNMKDDPFPWTLVNHTLPLCKSTNCFTRASPRPVPPYWRFMPESICLKGSNRYSWSSEDIPIPVSVTENIALFPFFLQYRTYALEVPKTSFH